MRKFIILLTLILSVTQAFAKDENIRLMVNSYLVEQAKSHIEQTIPQGQYSLMINTELSHSKLNDFENASFSMPMGSTVTAKEIGMDSQVDMTRYLDAIKKIDVQLKFASHISPEIRQLVQDDLKTILYFEEGRGDRIMVSDLPQTIALNWDEDKKQISQVNFGVSTLLTDVKKLSSMEMTGIIVMFGIILAAGTIFAGMQFFGVTFGKSTSALVKAVETMSESKGSAAPTQAQTLNAVAAGKEAQMSHDYTGPVDRGYQQQFFKNVDKETMLMFTQDCLESDQFVTVPLFLMTQVLEDEKSNYIELALPKNYYEENISKSILFSSAEIESLLKKNYINYKKCARSELSHILMKMNHFELQTFFSQLETKDLLIAISHLLPMKRERYMMMMDIETKFNLATLSHENMQGAEVKAVEDKLKQKTMKILNENALKTESVQFKHLESIFLSVNSFEEDEIFFAKSQESHTKYRSILSLLDNPESFWIEANLSTVAHAYFGYSDKIVNKLLTKFDGKQKEWLKHFIGQAVKVKMSFNHQECVNSRQHFLQFCEESSKIVKVDNVINLNKAA